MEVTKILPPQFPPLLRQLAQAPDHLYLAGTLPPPEFKYLCVIGARDYDEYGRDACEHLIAGLRNYPVVIVSGLALGIDSIAHEAAIRNGLRTISFPGSGLSEKSLYPPSHLQLALRIISSGNALLSPFEIEQEGIHWTFPVRNQLMAGCSHATLVIQGRVGSGTLITARYALEANRDVLIVPGSIFSELTYGPHLLYHEGATPVMSSLDILEALGFEVERPKPVVIKKPRPWSNWSKKKKTEQDKTISHLQVSQESLNQNQSLLFPSDLSPTELAIIRALQYKPTPASELIQKLTLTATDFNITITGLELKGLVKQHNGVFRINHAQF